MKMRRFFAKDMRSALNQVTAELGADAAIMSSSNVSGGVELVAAIDYDESLLASKSQNMKSQQSLTNNEVNESFNQLSESLTKVISSSSKKEQERLSRISQDPIEKSRWMKKPFSSTSEVSHSKSRSKESEKVNSGHKNIEHENRNYEDDSVVSLSFPPSTLATENKMMDEANSQSKAYSHRRDLKREKGRSHSNDFPNIEWLEEPTLAAMRKELNLLRHLLQDQVSQLAWQQKEHRSPNEAALVKELNQLHLSDAIVSQLVHESQPDDDLELSWQKSLGLLAKKIETINDDIIAHGGIVSLVGSTGVGKTTTVAKLAAQHILKYGKDSTAIITTDSFRIGAHEQMRNIGQLLNVPIRSVKDGQSLKDALYLYSDKRLILVDTAGISAHDERLHQQLKCLCQDHLTLHHYLVISATAQQRVLEESMRMFSEISIKGCVLTKLDEASSLGEVISTIINNNIRVAYTTDGQRIPDDIRIAKAHHLVAKLVWLSRHSLKSDSTQATGT